MVNPTEDLQRILELRRQEQELILASEQALNREPHQYYIPVGKVEEWLDMFGTGDLLTTLLSGANGIGKTTAIANVVANLAFPCDNPYFQQKIFKDWPFPNKQGRIVSNHNTLTETLIPTLKEWLPVGRYTTRKDSHKYEYYWETDTGWSWNILTYDQPLDAHESANLSWVLFDEPPSEAIYKATVARLRRGGVIGILATLLKGSGWIYDAIMTNKDLNSKVGHVVASAEDACIDHGVRGFLKHKDILAMMSQYNADDMQARILGLPQHLTGLVFKEWDRKIHVIKPFDIGKTNKDYVVYHSLDPHPRNPDAIVWVAIDRNGRKIVIDELYDNFTDKELAARIKEKDDRYPVIKRLIDPAALIEDQHTKSSLYQRLKNKHGLTYYAGSKKRAEATRAIKEHLSYHMVNGEFLQAPMLLATENCARFIWEMEHWQYDNWKGKTGERKDLSEKPMDKDDHAIEAVGRILLDDPQHKDITPHSTRRGKPQTATSKRKLLDPYS